jgi:hypothetical protein
MDEARDSGLRPAWWRRGSVIGRAAVLAPVCLALWWFVLKAASLWLLRMLVWLPLVFFVAPAGPAPVKIDPATGEWLFNVEVNTTTTDQRTGQSQLVNSMEFAVSENGIAAYASGWFCYLALALSTLPFSRKQAGRTAAGLGLQTVLNVAALAAMVYLVGLGSIMNSPNGTDSRLWLVKYLDHIDELVIPFVGPFFVALAVHPEWREYVAHSLPGSRQARPDGDRSEHHHGAAGARRGSVRRGRAG